MIEPTFTLNKMSESSIETYMIVREENRKPTNSNDVRIVVTSASPEELKESQDLSNSSSSVYRNNVPNNYVIEKDRVRVVVRYVENQTDRYSIENMLK